MDNPLDEGGDHIHDWMFNLKTFVRCTVKVVRINCHEMKEARMAQIARRLVLPGVAAIGFLALAKRHVKGHRKTADAPQTEGRVLHAARWYDLFGTLISLGRDKAIRQQLISIAAPAPGEKVLDVGCGTGTLALALDSQVGTGEIHGIDASPEMIEVARKKATQSGATIDFQVALIEAIPFPDVTFDLVTSSLMLHHLPDDLKRRGLAEIRRVVKSDGRFVAVDFAAQGHGPLGHLLAIFGHARGEPMTDKLRPLLEAAGFSNVQVIPTRHKNFAFLRAR